MLIKKNNELPIEFIRTNPKQPRKNFRDEEIEELKNSICEYGVLQPIIVKKENHNDYLLIAGERRLKASQLAGLTKIPVIIRESDSVDTAVIALIENVQRENLTFLEEAYAYKQLIKEFGMTQSEIANKVGKKQSTISNKIRILSLPEDIQKVLYENNLTERHGRALLKLLDDNDRRQVIKRIIDNNLNVKQTEKLIEEFIAKKTTLLRNNNKRGYINYKIYINTIKIAFSQIEEIEKNAEYKQIDRGDYMEVNIIIPKSEKKIDVSRETSIFFLKKVEIFLIIIYNNSIDAIGQEEKMGKAIAIFNQKGGVGKTTTNINLGASLAMRGKKILMLDIDPQGNTTSGVGISKKELENTIYELIVEENYDTKKAIIHTNIKNLDLIPASVSLAGAEVELVTLEGREKRLKKALDKVKDMYDYIFIDCPPSLGLLTINSLTAVDSVLIPIQCEFYALEGVSQLVNTIELVRKNFNKKLEIEGVILSMFDGRTNLSVQVVQEVKKYFGSKVYSTVIPRNIRLAEAPSFGMAITEYDPKSKGAEAYSDFADEFLDWRN